MKPVLVANVLIKTAFLAAAVAFVLTGHPWFGLAAIIEAMAYGYPFSSTSNPEEPAS